MSFVFDGCRGVNRKQERFSNLSLLSLALLSMMMVCGCQNGPAPAATDATPAQNVPQKTTKISKSNLKLPGEPGKLASASLPATVATSSDAPVLVPENSYREDERIMLRLVTQDILELEKKKEYSKVYEHYGSQDFKRNVSRRDFLRMTNCLEKTLGEINDFNRNDWKFIRQKANAKIYDTTRRPVLRSGGNLDEVITYVLEGVDFKLNAIYWSSDRKDYLACMRTVAKTMKKPTPDKPVAEKSVAVPPPTPATAVNTPATSPTAAATQPPSKTVPPPVASDKKPPVPMVGNAPVRIEPKKPIQTLSKPSVGVTTEQPPLKPGGSTIKIPPADPVTPPKTPVPPVVNKTEPGQVETIKKMDTVKKVEPIKPPATPLAPIPPLKTDPNTEQETLPRRLKAH